MSRTKSAFLGVISSQLFTIITVVINIISTPFILKHLNSQVYGLSIIIFQVTSYFGLFDFGLAAGVEKYLAGTRSEDLEARNNVKKIISTSFIVNTILGCFVAIIGNVLAPFINQMFTIPPAYHSQVRIVVGVVSVLIGLQFILRAISGVFFAHQKQFLSNSLGFIISITNTAFLVVFVYFGFGLLSFIYAQIIVFVVNSVLTISLFRKYYSYITISFKNFDKILLKEMFNYGFFLFIIGISVQVVFQTDRIVVGSMISLVAVSVYSLSTRIPELSSQLIWKIVDNSFPGIVELAKSEATEAFKTTHDKLMQLTLSFSTVAFWMILLISYPFLKLWVGEKYFGGYYFILAVAYLYLIQFSFVHVTSVCLNAAGIAKRISNLSIFEAVLNIAFSIWFVKIFGLVGVVLGTITAGFITSVWYIPYLAIHYMKRSWVSYVFCVLKPIFICSSLDVIIYLLFRNTFNNVSSWPGFLLTTFIAGILCAIPLVYINKNMLLSLKLKFLDR